MMQVIHNEKVTLVSTHHRKSYMNGKFVPTFNDSSSSVGKILGS